jgi:hypothetical protein
MIFGLGKAIQFFHSVSFYQRGCIERKACEEYHKERIKVFVVNVNKKLPYFLNFTLS